ncbi:O-methyltransferase [Bacteroidia bacterium]|nr:O-methyltransferase [Bacteroidia bacterium]
MITKVIEEKTPYYVFDDIENLRKVLLISENETRKMTSKETQHKNYGALLFRLVNFFKSQTVLQIGSSTGIMSLYLALPLRNSCMCYALEERKGLLKHSLDFIRENHVQNLHFMEGDYDESLSQLKAKVDSFDLIFINQTGNPLKTIEAIELVKPFIHKNSILIIDGIARNKDMKDLWKKINNHPKTRLTIDLLALGIIFFDEKLHKRHYKNYFDYGKKQNLYEKRRRRLNFIGRRKKGSKNQPAD